MVIWRYRVFIFLMLLSLMGCTNLPPLGISTQATTQTLAVTPVPTDRQTPEAPQPTAPTSEVTTPLAGTPLVTPLAGTPPASLGGLVTPQGTPPTSGTLLRIWLPPEFDPEGSSTASIYLKERLGQFMAENPEVRLEIRVKALEGEGSLVESLVAANVSAPLVLPDLVLLPRLQLETAALKGLLYPFDGLTEVMDDRNWFSYAGQLAHFKTSVYGLPFAGDALLLTYRPSLIENPPSNLDAYLQLGKEFLYPAADPQALFTLSVYLEGGGSLQDVQGRPFLDKTILTSVFEFYQRASEAGMMPYWLAQYSNDEQVWEAFVEDQHPVVITWASTFLKNAPSAPDDLAIASLPTRDGNPFTFATGWDWALAGHDPERRAMSVRLAEFLVEKEFMASWSSAAGYLPTRVDALQRWPEADIRQKIEQVSYSAHLIPSTDLIASLGPTLEQAVIKVLKSESNPQDAATAVINQVNQP